MRKLFASIASVASIAVATTAQAAPNTYDYITRGLICIHGYEGAWNDHNSSGNGYYGGLQMDFGFMRTYGSEFLRLWGTADKWPIYAQLAAGVRAYSTRGWHPWPNTARACHLL